MRSTRCAWRRPTAWPLPSGDAWPAAAVEQAQLRTHPAKWRKRTVETRQVHVLWSFVPRVRDDPARSTDDSGCLTWEQEDVIDGWPVGYARVIDAVERPRRLRG
jgi:hypothetical protein